MRGFLKLTVLAALLLPLTLTAQPGGGACGAGGGMMGMHNCAGGGKAHMERGMRMGMRGHGGQAGFLQLAEELKLTDQQKDKLKAMQTDFQMQVVDRRAALEKAEIKLRSLRRDQAPAADVNRSIDEVSRLRAEMQKAQYAHHQEMKGVLTADQVKQLETLRMERRAVRGEGMRGRMRGNMPQMPDDNEEED